MHGQHMTFASKSGECIPQFGPSSLPTTEKLHCDWLVQHCIPSAATRQCRSMYYIWHIYIWQGPFIIYGVYIWQCRSSYFGTQGLYHSQYCCEVHRTTDMLHECHCVASVHTLQCTRVLLNSNAPRCIQRPYSIACVDLLEPVCKHQDKNYIYT